MAEWDELEHSVWICFILVTFFTDWNPMGFSTIKITTGITCFGEHLVPQIQASGRWRRSVGWNDAIPLGLFQMGWFKHQTSYPINYTWRGFIMGQSLSFTPTGSHWLYISRNPTSNMFESNSIRYKPLFVVGIRWDGFCASWIWKGIKRIEVPSRSLDIQANTSWGWRCLVGMFLMSKSHTKPQFRWPRTSIGDGSSNTFSWST